MMSEQAFNILYFSPDLVSGTRFAVGAFVRDANKRSFVPNEHRPGAACLGGAQRAVLLDLVTDRARDLQVLDGPAVQRALGQYVQLGPEIALAERVPDIARWVADHVLPHPEEAARSHGSVRIRRDVAGIRYFEQRKLGALVHGRFRPEKLWHDDRPNAAHVGLSATHWVNGGDRVLMLEPVLVRDSDHPAREVHRNILALQRWLERVPAAKSSQVGAYILPGGPMSTRKDAVLLLRDATDIVYDTADPAQADHLDDDVRAMASRTDIAAADVH